MIPIKPKIKKILLAVLVCAVCVIYVCCCAVTVINAIMLANASGHIYSPDGEHKETYDCILVLGAGVRDGKPSDMLRDRLDTAIALYFDGVAPKLLVSGDHGSLDYDEVNVMKSYAMDAGVPSEDIFMDHAGFSTYESIYRAKAIFCVSRMMIVTQEYHLPRALYIAESFEIEACGVSADLRTYIGSVKYNIREVAARVKDFFSCIAKPLPTYLGEEIPIDGNGDITNDK